jgi:hypothetical protein
MGVAERHLIQTRCRYFQIIQKRCGELQQIVQVLISDCDCVQHLTPMESKQP